MQTALAGGGRGMLLQALPAIVLVQWDGDGAEYEPNGKGIEL